MLEPVRVSKEKKNKTSLFKKYYASKQAISKEEVRNRKITEIYWDMNTSAVGENKPEDAISC